MGFPLIDQYFFYFFSQTASDPLVLYPTNSISFVDSSIDHLDLTCSLILSLADTQVTFPQLRRMMFPRFPLLTDYSSGAFSTTRQL